jgi:hypothetical protein
LDRMNISTGFLLRISGGGLTPLGRAADGGDTAASLADGGGEGGLFARDRDAVSIVLCPGSLLTGLVARGRDNTVVAADFGL